MFSNHSKARPGPPPASKLQVATHCAALKKAVTLSSRKDCKRWTTVLCGSGAEMVKELVRKCKIQGKLYGIECQNVISIRPYYGAPISSWLRRPGNLDSGSERPKHPAVREGDDHDENSRCRRSRHYSPGPQTAPHLAARMGSLRRGKNRKGGR